MDEKESTKIIIPPLSADEEGKEVVVDLEEEVPQEEVVESADSILKSIKHLLIEGKFSKILTVKSSDARVTLQRLSVQQSSLYRGSM